MAKARSPVMSSKLAAVLRRRRRMRSAEEEHPIIGIQKSVGNEATMRMLQDEAQNPKEEKQDSKLATGAMAIAAALSLLDFEEEEDVETNPVSESESQTPADPELESPTIDDLAIDALPSLTAAIEPAQTPDYEKYMSPYSQEHDTQGGYGGLESSSALPSIAELSTLFGYDIAIPGEADMESKQRDDKKDSVLSELNAPSIDDKSAFDEGPENEDERDSSQSDSEQAEASSEHPGKEQEELQRARETNAKRILKQQKARRRLELLKH